MSVRREISRTLLSLSIFIDRLDDHPFIFPALEPRRSPPHHFTVLSFLPFSAGVQAQVPSYKTRPFHITYAKRNLDDHTLLVGGDRKRHRTWLLLLISPWCVKAGRNKTDYLFHRKTQLRYLMKNMSEKNCGEWAY